MPAYGWVVAVATALQESSLTDLPNGRLDSLGLFQQRARPIRQLSPRGHLRRTRRHGPRPRTGKTVEVVHNVLDDPYFRSQLALVARPSSATSQLHALRVRR